MRFTVKREGFSSKSVPYRLLVKRIRSSYEVHRFEPEHTVIAQTENSLSGHL